MAFVSDHSDPSGLGMFSKPGRFTTEKHIIFQRKEEILNDQRKFLKVNKLPHLAINPDEKTARKDEKEEDLKPRILPKSKSKPVISVFEKTLSRDEVDRAKGKRFIAPPIGFYHPKYQQVERKTLTLFHYDSEKPREFESPLAHLSKTLSKEDFDSLSKPPIADTPKKKTFSCVDFEKQLDRGRFFKAQSDPHEERFTIRPLPTIYSKYKRETAIDFAKNRGRDKNLFIKNLEYSPDYYPNFEFGRKRIINPGPKFETMSSRKPMHKTTASLTESSFNVTLEDLSASKHMRSPKFDKSLARESDPLTPLPSFMQKTVTSRISIGQLSQKTLEINGYSNRELGGVYSSFKGKSIFY